MIAGEQYKITRSIIKRLPSRYQKFFWILLSGMFIAACVETLALGVIAFFITAVSDPEAALRSSVIKRLHDVLPFEFFTSADGLVLFMCIFVVGIVVGKNLVTALVIYFSSRYSAYTRSHIGGRLLNGFLYLPYEWHLSKNSADLVLGVMWRHFFGALLNASLQGLKDILVVAVLMATLIAVEPFISLVTILAVGGGATIIFSTVRISLDRIATLSKEYKQSINRDVATGIQGLKDVKTFGREDVFTYNYRRKAHCEARVDAWQQLFLNLPRWILEILGFLMFALAICLMYFYMDASTDRITGMMALLAVTAWRVLPAVSNILSSLTATRQMIPYVKTGLEYLSTIETHRKTVSPHKRKADVNFSFRESIQLENVSFAYSGVEIYALRNVNLKIEKGETVGIVGASGAGKSTLVDLFLGLLAPTKGRIFVDEQVFKNSMGAAWIRMIGYVQQSPYICDGTLAENVAFGLKGDGIDGNRVLECCKMAAMEDFLTELPNGIDTPIGERGVKLSGGQRQRVSIARALYNYPEIMIFDEATSSLDTKSEKAIQQTIYSFKGKQTLIIIAHRLSTVENCDRIIWLEKGEIVKTGKPDDILPKYRQLMKEKR